MLDRADLLAFVTDLAGRRDLWAHLVRHEPSRRTYEELVLREDVGIWLICWMDDHDTGFHDHDVSSGAVAVVRGCLKEERLSLAGSRSRIYSTGESFDFAASDIHRMCHPGGEPAVSLHAYSPPLARMGSYSIEDDGLLRRVSIPYAEELRPRAGAA